jgi:UDP-N-acetylmuramate dehydrogenase
MVSFIDLIKTYGELKEDVSIKTLTSFRIGGIAKYVVYPNDLEGLKEILLIIADHNIPYKIWGMGSNILASDDYYYGIIIKLDKLLNKLEINDDSVVVGAGVSLIALAYKTCLLGYSGFEYATGIPGSVGGALYMNAGAYKHDTYEILKRVLILKNGEVVWLNKDEIQFSYRHTSFSEHKDWIILEAEFNLVKGTVSDIEKIVNDRKERRMKSQPLNLPSAGSVFRNPDSISAWQIIDEVGLRGKRIGGAMISDIHSNFIVNIDNAKAQDVLDLIELAKLLVKERTNIDLIPEIELFNWSNK